MPKRLDIIGETYDRLTVIAEEEKRGSKRYFLCSCECGRTSIASASNLRSGHTRSCGCLLDETRTTHGMVGTATYSAWVSMIQRCKNPKNPGYKNYGARGIEVCDRWLNSFEAFYEDMGQCPEGYSIERRDVNANYQYSNCEWIPIVKQASNKRNSHKITHEGVTKTITQWARDYNIELTTLTYRMYKLGIPFEEAVTTPSWEYTYNWVDGVSCPNCGSAKITTSGTYTNKTGVVQRLRCTNCRKRFS